MFPSYRKKKGDLQDCFQWSMISPGIYLLNVNNRNTGTRCEICSKLTIKTRERCHWRRSGVLIVNFEHISLLVLVFLLLTLNIKLPAGIGILAYWNIERVKPSKWFVGCYVIYVVHRYWFWDYVSAIHIVKSCSNYHQCNLDNNPWQPTAKRKMVIMCLFKVFGGS